MDPSLATGSSTPVYWNGGGCFETDGTTPGSVRILARYAELPNSPAAIVASAIGQGMAILTSPHPEHPLVGQSNYSSELLRKLLQLLGLQVSSANALQVPNPTPQYILSARSGAAQEAAQKIIAKYEGRADSPLVDAADTFCVSSQLDAQEPPVSEQSDNERTCRHLIPCSTNKLPFIAFFNPQDFLAKLTTKSIGQLLLYSEVVTSTQSLLDKFVNSQIPAIKLCAHPSAL